MYTNKFWLCACIAGLMVGCGSETDVDDGFTGLPGPSVTGDAGTSNPGTTGTPAPSGSGVSTTPPGNNTPPATDSGRPTQPPGNNTGNQMPPTTIDSGITPPDGGADTDTGSGSDEGGTTVEPTPSAGCLEGITNYKTKGKFTYKTETSGSVKMWVPDVPAGCKVPVIHLSNGTGATCSAYGAILQHLASHGFLATCYENTNTGQGTMCIMALEAAYSKHPEIADNKIGSTGHSQGGGAAFTCLSRAEEKWGDSKIYAGHSMEPASGFGDSPSNWKTMYGKIKSPMFMFNGSADILVSASWVGDAFNALPDTTESYWYEATGAAHIPVPTTWTQESAVVFFRWKLLGDKAACEYFKKMPDGNEWNLRKKQAEKGC